MLHAVGGCRCRGFPLIQGISQREMDHCWPELEPTVHVRLEEEDVGSLDHVEHLTGRTERLVGIREAGR